jgi:WD40 repeat protein
MTACVYSEEDQVLVVGLSNGKLMQYRKKGFEMKNILTTKDYEIVRFSDVGGGHKGEIRCLCYEMIKGSRYMITGSMDRTIKIWENDPKAK